MHVVEVMDTKISDYREKTGTELEVILTTVIHGAMDTESGRDIGGFGWSWNTKGVCRRAPSRGAKPRLRDLRRSQTKHGTPRASKRRHGHEQHGPRSDGVLERGPGPTTEQRDIHLGAMGKGGKGGKDTAAACWRCGGKGYQARSCPTPEEGKGSHACYECGENGPYGRDHDKGSGKPDAKGYKGRGLNQKWHQKGGYTK